MNIHIEQSFTILRMFEQNLFYLVELWAMLFIYIFLLNINNNKKGIFGEDSIAFFFFFAE